LKKHRFLMAAIGFLLLAGLLPAQDSSARIFGTVTDNEAQPLPGVSVMATSPKLVGSASKITDGDGVFRILALTPGTYKLVFSLQGFKTLERENVVLTLGQTLQLNVSLELGGLETKVTVIGQAPLVDVRSTTKGQVMGKEVFDTLPGGRNFDGLISTIAGVQYEQKTGGLSVDGASGGENTWHVDGQENTNAELGTRSFNAVYELVDEVQVEASGLQAEFGGATGGVVNIVTRSGGNAFHGDIAAYYNDQSRLMMGHTRDYLRLNPTDSSIAEYVNNDTLYFNGGKDRDVVRRSEFILSLGGYIIKDKLWFFAAYDPVFNSTKARRSFLSASDPQAKSDFSKKTNEHNFQAKLSAQPFSALRLQASVVNNFSNYRGAIPNITGSGDPTYMWGKEGLDYPNLTTSIRADYTGGNNFLASLRGGYWTMNQTNQQIKMPGTNYVFAYSNSIFPEIPADLIRYEEWTSWSTNLEAATTKETKANQKSRATVGADINYYLDLAGQHSWKAGIQWDRDAWNRNSTTQHPSVFLYWGVPYTMPDGTVVNGKYGHYEVRGSFKAPFGEFFDIHRERWSAYLQDSWTIKNRLTLNIGLRAESLYVPSFSPLPEFKDVRPMHWGLGDLLAPRLGVVYDVLGDSSLKVFGSFGIYYDAMKYGMGTDVYGGKSDVTDFYSLDNYNWLQIAASGRLDDQTGQSAGGTYYGSRRWVVPSFDTTDPNAKPLSQREITLGVERKLSEEISFSARFVQKHLIRTMEDQGVVLPSGDVLYYQLNPGFGWSLPVSQGGRFDDRYWATPKAKREYSAVNISIDKRFSNNWQGGVNYTWSRLTGNYSGLGSSDENGRLTINNNKDFDDWFLTYDLKGNELRGPLQNDRTHFFKAYGSYVFPFGLTVGLVGYGRSGLPLTKVMALDDQGRFYPENRMTDGRLPFTFYADVYMEYAIKIQRARVSINLSIFNATNTKTAQDKYMRLTRATMYATFDEILSKNFDYKSRLKDYVPDPRFGKVASYFNPWTAQVGAKISF